jgi:hypothetical protein
VFFILVSIAIILTVRLFNPKQEAADLFRSSEIYTTLRKVIVIFRYDDVVANTFATALQYVDNKIAAYKCAAGRISAFDVERKMD